MENPPYCTPFNFIKQITSSLREAINRKVEFCIQLSTKNNNVYEHVYVYACVVSKLVVKKSTKPLHFGPVLLTNDSYNIEETSVKQSLPCTRKFLLYI